MQVKPHRVGALGVRNSHMSLQPSPGSLGIVEKRVGDLCDAMYVKAREDCSGDDGRSGRLDGVSDLDV
jgi:hypothetical protein